MPKILINEKDNTSPGALGSYANYAVLIVGVQPRTPILTEEDLATAKLTDEKATIDAIQPDSNGVYEFSSASAFEKTIGLTGPEVELDKNGKITTFRHYGNQMAYELLNMGYPVVYKPISSFSDIMDADFWSIFRDKASYDFRFITHGLLESSVSEAAQEAYNEKKEELDDLDEKIKLLKEACNKLEGVYAKADADAKAAVEDQVTNPGLEYADAFPDALTNAYNIAKLEYVDENGITKFVNEQGTEYKDYSEASTGFNTRLTAANGAYEVLKSDMEDDFSDMLTKDGINTVNSHIADLAMYTALTEENSTEIPGRGDCVALIELDEKTYSNTTSNEKPESLIIKAIDDMSLISSNKAKGAYCALTVPSVHYKMSGDAVVKCGNNKKFPGAFHYLACFMNSIKSGFAEWYAAAGYTRGVSGYTIDYTTVKLGEIAINALEPRKAGNGAPKFACNVIANFRGSYYLWGNRTAHNLDESDLVASHFLNIRQLCTTIKKQLYVACRRFTFDPNSDTLWFNFVNAIRPTLETMKADQGIRDYKILKVYEENPKKATLKAKIRIIPIEAVEDFDLEVSLEDSFGETTATVGEPQ